METDWILKDPEKISSQQVYFLYFLMEMTDLERCVAFLHPTNFKFQGISMSSKKGSYLTFPGPRDGDKFSHCRPVTYEELVEMFRKEIESKIKV